MSKKFFIILFLLVIAHCLWIHITRWRLPELLIQNPVLIEGEIGSIPQKKFRGESFIFHVKTLDHQKINTHFLLSWYHHPPKLYVGQHWQFRVKLKPPIGSHNPGGFNYANFLIHQGISATGYVQSGTFLKPTTQWSIDALREKIQAQISLVIHDSAISAFISALCVGLRTGLTESDWQVFQKTGTNHLVAIAGLHIGFLVTSIYFLCNKLVRRFPKILLHIPANQIAEITALCAAIFYAMLSGFAIPTQRASIMLFVFLIAKLFYQNISIWNRFWFAVFMVLLLHPFDYDDASFWLSFISVGLLIWMMSNRLQSPSHLISYGKMQWTMVLGLAPLMLWFFQQISFVSFIANAIAIPWVGFVILPICFSACILVMLHCFSLSGKLFLLAGKCLSPVWKILQFLAHLSFSSWHHALSNVLILFAGMLGVIILLAPRKFPAKWLGCFGLLPVFFYHPLAPSFGDFQTTVIDVGQGLSVLIQTQNHVMLYDTGAHFPGGFDYGESVVTPYLREKEVSRINRLEISHGDNDHSGGALAIVKNFDVNNIFTSAPKLVKQFHGYYCDATQQWTWDGVNFTTLNPAPNTPYEDNNSSCVIKITGKHGQLLLTGDIEHETEWRLVEQYGKQLHSTILVVPHHGSRTSSSAVFLSAVLPKYAIISAGKYNRYHLPAKMVTLRYLHNNIRLYNTADFGAVFIRFSRTGQVKLGTE